MSAQEVYPVFNKIIQREEKERFLKQKAKVIWLTGLSGSGKTTIGTGLEKELFKRNFFAQMLDGDNIRTGINNNLGFSVQDRIENIRRIAEVSKLFLNCGIITISCFIAPTHTIRKMAREIIGKEDFLEIYINAPLEICEQRDVKGLYKKARRGEIKDFTGIQAPYEVPDRPDIIINTDEITVEKSVEKLLNFILPKIEYKHG